MDISKIKYVKVSSLIKERTDGLKDSIKLTIHGDTSEYNALKKTKKYKTILSSGIKINFKQDKREIAEEPVQAVYKDATTRFNEILFESITSVKDNPHMITVYEKVVNNRII
jgi:hypothetical protein